MLYDNYFEEMEVLFKYLDTKKTGKIKKNDLVDAVAKLRKSIDKTNAEDGKPKCDLRVPSEDDLDHVYSSMIVEEEGSLNWDEYLITLFKVTLESSDWLNANNWSSILIFTFCDFCTKFIRL